MGTYDDWKTRAPEDEEWQGPRPRCATHCCEEGLDKDTDVFCYECRKAHLLMREGFTRPAAKPAA